MKRKILYALILLATISTAAAFPAQLSVEDRTATMDDPATFNLTVENSYAEQESFRISSILAPPVASDWFDYEYSKDIEPGTAESFLINVTPSENAIQQNYAFTVNVRSLRPDDLEKRQSYVSVRNRFDLSITSLQLSTTEADPGETVNVSATVRNTASGTLDDFRVELSGFDQNLSESGTVLGSSDSIRYNFQLEVPNGEMPGNETVELAVFNDGERQQHVAQEVKIRQVENVERDVEVEDQVLTNTRTFTLTNTGNVNSSVQLNSSQPVYIDPLVSFDTEPSSIETEGNESVYSWELELEPGEAEDVSYTVNYAPALGFLALFFLGVLGLKKLQTDIKFSKEAKTEDGEVKVTIQIENNSGSPESNLRVEDFVPDVAEVSSDFDFAKPVRTKTSSGTRLRWDIDELESGEQRVFEYRLKPLVEVEGGAVLPAAEISREGEQLKQSSEIEVEFRPE